MRKPQISLVVYTFLCALVAACATLNLTAPQTLEDRVMTGYATVGATYRTIADLAQRKSITKEHAQLALGRADDAKTLLDNADTLLSTGNPQSAGQSLQFAITILSALEKELQERALK